MILLDVPEPPLLCCCPSVNNKLLKELARTENVCGLPLSLKETICIVLELSDSFISGSLPPISIWDVLVLSGFLHYFPLFYLMFTYLLM